MTTDLQPLIAAFLIIVFGALLWYAWGEWL